MTCAHVSRSSEHVRFSEACTGVKVISAAGVLGEYSLTGLQADILGGHDTGEAVQVRLHLLAHKLRLACPISRFVLQKDSEDRGYYSLCSRPR